MSGPHIYTFTGFNCRLNQGLLVDYASECEKSVLKGRSEFSLAERLEQQIGQITDGTATPGESQVFRLDRVAKVVAITFVRRLNIILYSPVGSLSKGSATFELRKLFAYAIPLSSLPEEMRLLIPITARPSFSTRCLPQHLPLQDLGRPKW